MKDENEDEEEEKKEEEEQDSRDGKIVPWREKLVAMMRWGRREAKEVEEEKGGEAGRGGGAERKLVMVEILGKMKENIDVFFLSEEEEEKRIGEG